MSTTSLGNPVSWHLSRKVIVNLPCCLFYPPLVFMSSTSLGNRISRQLSRKFIINLLCWMFVLSLCWSSKSLHASDLLASEPGSLPSASSISILLFVARQPFRESAVLPVVFGQICLIYYLWTRSANLRLYLQSPSSWRWVKPTCQSIAYTPHRRVQLRSKQSAVSVAACPHLFDI